MGQIGQAFSNPNTFAPDPSGFSGSEWAARFMGGAAKGLGQGMQNMAQQGGQQRGGGGFMPQSAPPQPAVNLKDLGAIGGWGGTAADQPNPLAKRAQNPFFGGYNPG